MKQNDTNFMKLSIFKINVQKTYLYIKKHKILETLSTTKVNIGEWIMENYFKIFKI